MFSLQNLRFATRLQALLQLFVQIGRIRAPPPVTQVSKPAVSPTSQSAAFGIGRKPADLKIHDTADLKLALQKTCLFQYR
jgi:hypothetical protein